MKRRARWLSVLVAAYLAFLMPAGAEAAIRKYVFTIPPAAFTWDGQHGTYVKSLEDGYLAAVDGPACFTVPVVFPQGARRVVAVRIYVRSTNDRDEARFDFNRIELATGRTNSLGFVKVPETGGVVAYTIPLSTQRLSTVYTYQITTCLPQNVFVYGVKVIYSR